MVSTDAIRQLRKAWFVFGCGTRAGHGDKEPQGQRQLVTHVPMVQTASSKDRRDEANTNGAGGSALLSAGLEGQGNGKAA